ncbi:hypothetical protein [Sphingomonas oligophenolica]|uniref:hypothetical protein n=1 Tax=Sphingomonas oligophenolica TaxID=301154 RepID=UPI0031DF312A
MLVQTSIGHAAEANENKARIERVRTAFVKEDFAALDAMENDYRGSGGSTQSGASKLQAYYEALNFFLSGLNPPGQCDTAWQPYLDRWRKASPQAPAPIIANAALIEARAWCYRGDGPAGSVGASAWQPYEENIEAAAALLRQEEKAASIDPQYYAEMERLYVAQGRSRAEFRHLLDEASARYPYYYNIYFEAQRYFQPHWYGSNADIELLARYAVEKTRARDGKSAYARIYWHSVLCGCTDELAGMDWPVMQTAMADLAERYPVDWTYLKLIQLACLRGEADEARKYFARLTVNDAGAWSREDWERCRQLVGPNSQAFPEGTE